MWSKRSHRLMRTVVLLLGVVIGTGCSVAAGGHQKTTLPPDLAQAVSDSSVIAEGQVVPRREAELAFNRGGRVAKVQVAAGDQVQAGQLLVTLSDAEAQAAIAQAEAALATSQARVAELEARPRAEQEAAAEAAVDAARTQVGIAEAQLARAQTGLAQAAAQITSAQAALTDLTAGASPQERRIAALRVEMARNELWAAQGYRDGVKGAYERKQAQQYDVDKAEAAVGVAHVAHTIAQQEQERIEAGARAGTIAQARAAVAMAEEAKAQAQAAVDVAQAQLESARAALSQGMAQAALARAPATLEELAVARAATLEARAGLQAARAALAELSLYAPIAGTISRVEVAPGEQAAPLQPVVGVADLSAWEIETQDLTEIEVVQVGVGQAVVIRPDALPEAELTGTVMAIDPCFEEKRGDVTYRVRIRLEVADKLAVDLPHLRWGMTVEVRFAS